jgi:hypothetical protein
MIVFIIIHWKNVYVIKHKINIGILLHVLNVNIHNIGIMEIYNVKYVQINKYII